MSTKRSDIITRLTGILRPDYEVGYNLLHRPNGSKPTVVIIPKSESVSGFDGNPATISHRELSLMIVLIHKSRDINGHLDDVDEIEKRVTNDQEIIQMSSKVSLGDLSFERFDESSQPVFVSVLQYDFKYTVVYGD